MQELKYFDIVYKVLKNWYINFAEFTPSLISGILIFIFFLFFSRFLSKVSVNIFQKIFPKNSNQDTVVGLIGLFRFIILLAGVFISLEVMGLNGFFVKFIGSIGVAGIIAGVALKDLVSSIFSGFLVGVDKAFKVGDYVTIQNITGVVEEIGLLTTKIINEEGKKVHIPNQLIFSSPFINITASSRRKIIIDLEIRNSDNIKDTRELLVAELQKFDFIDEPQSADVIIVSKKIDYYSLQIIFWTKQKNIQKVRGEALLALKKRLDQEQIQMTTTN